MKANVLDHIHVIQVMNGLLDLAYFVHVQLLNLARLTVQGNLLKNNGHAPIQDVLVVGKNARA